MRFKIFISSVQREFAKERKALADYIRKDVILNRFFDVFLFEEVPAQERFASGVYLAGVDECDIYLCIAGAEYGNVDRKGVSATEREYQRAEAKGKTRICFVAKTDRQRDPRETAFVRRIEAEVTRRSFDGWDSLRTGVYAALAKFLEGQGRINDLPFDAAKTAKVALPDLSIAKIRSFVRDAREKRDWKVPANASPLRVLTALELVDDEGQIANSAELLFGKRPQRFFRSSEVKCMQYYADRVSKPMGDYRIFEGDVFQLSDQATDFVMAHIRNWVGTRAEGETAAVPTKFELPRDAVKEAIVNAVCHRDYNSLGSVQVMLFSDRLEVSSPGGLPKGMTVAKLHKAHRSLPVNPLLAQAMFLRGYIEKAGTGTEDMIAKCREWGVDIPIWEMEDADGFKVILRRPTFGGSAFPGPSGRKGRGNTQATAQVGDQVSDQVGDQVGDQVSVAITSNANRVIAVMDGEVCAAEIRNRVGIASKRYFRMCVLQHLLDASLIEPTQPNSPRSPTQKYRLTAKGRTLAAQLVKKVPAHG